MRKYRPIWTLLVLLAALQSVESNAQCFLPEQPNLNGPFQVCHEDNPSNYVIPAPGTNSDGVTYTINLSGGGEVNILSPIPLPGEHTPAFHLSITWMQSGTHTLRITPVNDCGEGPSLQVNITVGLENEDVIQIENEDSPCLDAYTLFVPVYEGHQYQWNLDGNPIADATSSTYSATQSGAYSITITNTASCTSTSSERVISIQPLPEAIVTPGSSTSFCSNGSVVLQAPIGTALTYQWQLNGNTIPDATNPSYIATETGSYSVILSNSEACQASSNPIEVTVNPLPVATPTPSGATSFCSGGSVLLNAGSTGTGLLYQWSLDGTNIPDATSSSYAAVTSGNYTVTITNIFSCSATSLPIMVTVNPLPVAIITPSSATTFCAGGNVVLNTGTGTDLTYQWKVYGSPISSAIHASYTAIDNGLYTVTITNSSGCSATSNAVPVTVNFLPMATITPGGSTSFCVGNNVTLYANTGSGLSYQWRLNDSDITGANSSSYSATQSGSYTVLVTNSVGCSWSSSPRYVVANPAPEASITPVGPITICAGSSVQLHANTGVDLAYQWKLNGTNLSGATSTSYSASSNGEYSLVVTNAIGCTATSSAVSVAVENFPVVTINNGAPTINVCDDEEVSLTANATGTNLSYSWLRNGQVIATENTPSISFTVSNSESVSVQVTTLSNCLTERSVSVNVTNHEDITISASGNGVRYLSDYNYVFCEGVDVTLESLNSYLQYQWKKNGVDLSGANSRTLSVNSSGNYSLHTLSYSGCAKLSRELTLSILDRPNLSLNYDGTVNKCVNDLFRLETQNLPGYSYRWFRNGSFYSFGDGGSKNTLTFPSLSTSQAGTYSVEVTNSSIGCKTTSSEIVLTVNSTIPSAIIESQSGSVCSSNGIELRANTGTDLSYQWKLNGTNISNATSFLYYAKNAGVYTVQVSKAGCSNISSGRTVDVSTPLVVTISGPESVCDGSNANLTVSATTSEGTPVILSAYSINWTGGSPTPDPTIRRISSSGNYSVRVTSIQYGCQYTGSKSVQNYSNIQQSGDMCLNNSVILTASLADAYLWSTGATTRSITAMTQGSYTVRTTNVNGGCTSSVGSTFVQSCTAAFQFSMESEEEMLVESASFAVFPNPADNLLTVSLPFVVKEGCAIQLFDQIGKAVVQASFEKGEQTKHIALDNFVSGAYILKIDTPQGVLIKKVVISH